MNAVAFSFGNHPSIPESDAVALAEILSRRGTVAAATVARKIKTEATGRHTSDDSGSGVDLTRAEMLALRAVLAECGTPSDPIAQLHQELEQTIADPCA